MITTRGMANRDTVESVVMMAWRLHPLLAPRLRRLPRLSLSMARRRGAAAEASRGSSLGDCPFLAEVGLGVRAHPAHSKCIKSELVPEHAQILR